MIPPGALFLGLMGLLPFVYCALVMVWPDFDIVRPYWGAADNIAQIYGLVILCFMAGALWGFATKTARPWGYILSVLPALWGFFIAATPQNMSFISLIYGFGGLLILDFWFWSQGLAPVWWMRLRLILTALVVSALFICDRPTLIRSLLPI
jgi:hypothetical protein